MPETVQAEVNANVWKVLVEPGDAVDEDSPMIILESMEREIPIWSEGEGIVVTVHVAEGDPVDPGQPLVDLATR